MTAKTAPLQASPQAVSRTILAASAGTVFEWYDFLVYGTMAPVLAKKFFSQVDPITGFILALLTFAAGFMMRPLGSLIFGVIGDRIGRKKCFLITVTLMAGSTVAMGCLPTYETIGIIAPLLLVACRLLQGIAVGGEYGGAATYVAEQAPPYRRAYMTSWISAAGTFGLLLSFVMIQIFRWTTGDDFETYGWRLPFIFSIVLLIASIYIRQKMTESVAFQTQVSRNTVSKSPLREAILVPANAKKMLIAFFMSSGMTAMFYATGFYPALFLTQTLKVDPTETNLLVMLASACCAPIFPLFGWVADRVGRRKVLILGYVSSIVLLIPAFHLMAAYGNPALVAAQATSPVTIEANPSTCSFMFNPIGTRQFKSSCDIARQTLAAKGVSYDLVSSRNDAAVVRVGTTELQAQDASGMSNADAKEQAKQFGTDLQGILTSAGYPEKAASDQVNMVAIFIIHVLLFGAAVITGSTLPVALTEMFPTKIRYTAMGLPYNLATGWVGGLLPTMIFAISVQNGNIFSGLWYPVAWACIALLVVIFFFKETKDVDINE
jgi:MFS family permease